MSSVKNFREMNAEELNGFRLNTVGGEFIVGKRIESQEHAFRSIVKFYNLADAVDYCVRADGGVAEHQIFESCNFLTPNFCDEESIRLGFNPSGYHGWAGFEKSGIIFYKNDDFLTGFSLPLEACVRVEKVFSSVEEAVEALSKTSYSANAVFEGAKLKEFLDLEQMVEWAENSWNNGDGASFNAESGEFYYGTPSIEIGIFTVEEGFKVILAYCEHVDSRLEHSSTLKSGSMLKAGVEQGWELKIPIGVYFSLPNDWEVKAAHPAYDEEAQPVYKPYRASSSRW